MSPQQRQQQRLHLNSRSQPDLTYGGGYVVPSAVDPQASAPQVRRHAKMATTAAASAERSARQRRYKIKRRMEGGGGAAQYAASAQSSPLRPTSAMDFAEPHQRAEREQAVVMRPHSVMGPFPGDGRNRVIQVKASFCPLNRGTRYPFSKGSCPISQGFLR